MGFDGIELWGQHIDDCPPSTLNDYLGACDLKVSMISPYFDFTGSRSRWEQSITDASAVIDYADEVGSPLIRAFTGLVGSADATGDQFDMCVEGLRLVSDEAASRDIGIALETHPKTLVDNVPATLRLLEAAGRPNLKVNLDIYHMWEIHLDPMSVLDSLYEHVAHVHAKNATIPPNSKEYPLLHDKQGSQDIIGVTKLADGNMPYDQFLNSLDARGFDGFVSLEWFGPDVETIAAAEINYLKQFRAGAA